MSKVKGTVDQFTLEIVGDSLIAIGEEMFHALARTSMSPIIYEVLDFASGLTDAKGQLLTQGNGVTGFIGLLSSMVREVIEKYGQPGALQPGDIVIINDPYGGGGSHLSDVGMVMPIFYEEEVVAFSANKAHWTEVGGKDPGSWTTDSTEVFQEGIQYPCIKLFERGRVNQALVELTAANVRFPEQSLGDMWAQVAGLRTGDRRFRELCEKYGRDTVLAAVEHLLNHGEQLALNELKKLPKGTFEAQDFIDDDGIGHGPFNVQVKVEITDDEFICDFRGSHPQVPGPVNCSYSALVSSVRTLFLAITNSSQDVNDGMFRPLKVLADKGSIFSAERPAAVSTYWETMTYGADLIWKALAPVLPHRLSAGHLLSVCGVVLAGTHPDSGEPFLVVEPTTGGWGAGADLDGANAQFCIGDGETYNVPIEVAETRYGILVQEYSLHTDGAGAGKNRGGCGTIRSYTALSDGQTITATFGRHKFRPWGFSGGQDGSRNEFEILKTSGEVCGPFGKYARFPLKMGDTVRMTTATGGGYGNPLERPADKVAKDVRNGYVSVTQAKEEYGVLIAPKTFALLGSTQARQQLATDRGMQDANR
ncbi:Hydantoinase B/oxoprolinase [Acididesulfobacillus acetoxydans]|uniref:Hydantoin utilization protein B n=1 Tax=Acididesulfobacillus acetoxydans TaxID=1561005 RepID=A0A8S0W7J1_9FIRM|nr:hydantoinase B/oxoprolinase family protein [Acididesulfobacillus acetoxydans]CAA7600829.1 Hydantoinase B/oxoprolinase [Acididesulfobacillus acetoxydans]CEJ09250.1 Hydantoin utilization protein B [Acididesulfobacillus acetoxydans]